MLQTRIWSVLAVAAGIVARSAPALAWDPTGLWSAAGGKARVRVTYCGPNICGIVASLSEPLDTTGRPRRDEHNVDPALRSRPIIGSPVILGMAPDGDNRWRGSVYNAEDGKTYTGSFALIAPDRALLKGCVALIFCKSQTWRRQ
jgi:uncharacterized protein (DUF2147 family)